MESISLTELRKLYPNQWILIGNPLKDENTNEIIKGIPIFHHADKKMLYIKGRDLVETYSKVAVIYTGEFSHRRKMTGIFNRV